MRRTFPKETSNPKPKIPNRIPKVKTNLRAINFKCVMSGTSSRYKMRLCYCKYSLSLKVSHYVVDEWLEFLNDNKEEFLLTHKDQNMYIETIFPEKIQSGKFLLLVFCSR